MKFTLLHRWQLLLLGLQLANLLGTIWYWHIPHRPMDAISTLFLVLNVGLLFGFFFLQIGYRIGSNAANRVLNDENSVLLNQIKNMLNDQHSALLDHIKNNR